MPALMQNSSQSGYDQCQVRIRGKNNQIETRTGSVNRTLEDLSDVEYRKKEMAKASDRLKQLEKLERYREERLHREIQIYEDQRRKEEEEILRQRDNEIKRQKYFDKQKDQVSNIRVKKTEEEIQKAKAIEVNKKQEKLVKKKREQELEDQKRKIMEYKAKKKQTEHLLANAEYIDYEDIANQTPDLEDGENTSGAYNDAIEAMARQPPLQMIKEKSHGDVQTPNS